MQYGQGSGQSSPQHSYIVHPEGMIKCSGNGNYEYTYFETDHLGSTRVVVAARGADGQYEKVVQQATDYYPFGLAHELNQLNTNRYLFSGKELQDAEVGDLGMLGLYDFHARYYNPTLGRWFNADPAQQFASPYLYAANNPAMFVDPDGMETNWSLPYNPLYPGYDPRLIPSHDPGYGDYYGGGGYGGGSYGEGYGGGGFGSTGAITGSSHSIALRIYGYGGSGGYGLPVSPATAGTNFSFSNYSTPTPAPNIAPTPATTQGGFWTGMDDYILVWGFTKAADAARNNGSYLGYGLNMAAGVAEGVMWGAMFIYSGGSGSNAMPNINAALKNGVTYLTRRGASSAATNATTQTTTAGSRVFEVGSYRALRGCLKLPQFN
jgi:RHS repeat-associated protein